MAEGQDSSQEKTEDATPRRMRESRKKGQVAKSRDLNTVVILIFAMGAIIATLGYMGHIFEDLMEQAFAAANQGTLGDRELFAHIGAAFYQYLRAVVPYLLIVMVAAIAIGFLQVGPVFSGEPMKMQAKRLNIVENIKNMAKITTLIELVKNVAKLFIVFLIAYLVVKKNLPAILASMLSTPLGGAIVAGHVLTSFMIRVCISFLLIAGIDFWVQRWNHKKQMRMSKDEVKREYKQDEGDPLIKSQRRQLHQELAAGDTKTAVGASDMVVTNPTELAIAIKYDEAEMIAPQITAKGQRLFAQQIKELAEEAGVPIMQIVPLAWALIDLDVGEEIPEELYNAVAELLHIVYRMRNSAQ